MASITYQILSKKPGQVSIFMRLSVSREINFRAKTGLTINKNDWSEAKKMPKQNTASQKNLHQKLVELKANIFDRLNNSIIEGDRLDTSWLPKQIELFFYGSTLPTENNKLSYWIEHLIKNSNTIKNGKGSVGLSKSRINSYKSLLATYLEYDTKEKYCVQDFDNLLFEELKDWLFNFKKYNASTAYKKLNDIQAVIRYATSKSKVKPSEDFKYIKFEKISTYDFDMDVITLTESEIQQIEKADLENEALINARKWLIIACFIGQRVNTFNRITKDNFKKYGGNYKIVVKQTKGNKTVDIPVLPRVKNIYEEGFPYKVSSQKLNKHIKEICRIAQINNLIVGRLYDPEIKRKVKVKKEKYHFITTHTGRRTFATLHYKKLPNEDIMEVTGHKRISTFLLYIGMNDDTHIDGFHKLYDI